ncbi:MAG: hypothetical protein C0432_05040 [Candidatus Puniceispirillum sp.]|nr:hypothetical protein [Candidatus Puniceispirillum sp.]
MQKITIFIFLVSTCINASKAISAISTSNNNQNKLEVSKTPDIQEIQNQQAVEFFQEYIKMQAARQGELAREADKIRSEQFQ